VAGDTAASLAQAAEELTGLATALGAQAELVGAALASASEHVGGAARHWSGPAADETLGVSEDYLGLVHPAVGAIESAQSTVSNWAASAEQHSSELARYEGQLDNIATDVAAGLETPDLADERRQATARIAEIRDSWSTACTTFAAEVDEVLSILLDSSLAAVSLTELTVLDNRTYAAAIAELAVITGIDLGAIDPSGWFETAVAQRAALLGSEDGAWMFALIETAHQGDLSKADGNLSADDILAASDPATVRALLLQAAEDGGFDLDEAKLDALVNQVVGTAWLMRSSDDEVWEDIDDDIEWYEQGVFKFVREEVFAPVASFAVGAACVSAAGVGTTVTGGASLAAVGYCGGLAAATYSAADSWANGGDLDDVASAFTDPETWVFGAATGMALQGATNYLLRVRPLGPTVASGVDDVAASVDDIARSSADDAVLRLTNGTQFETLAEAPISGTTRSAHRAAANRNLVTELENDPALRAYFDDVLGTDVVEFMRSGSGGLRNPPGAVWHHPAGDPTRVILIRRTVHTMPELQPTLHPGPNGGGGFAEFFGG
jgi:hypothetical protein